MLFLLATALAESGGHAAGPSATGSVLGGLVLVGVAYFIAHFVVDRLQRQFLFVSGAEYLLLGILLGPAGAKALTVFDNLGALAPVIAFAAGWIGLLYGMELHLRTLLDDDRGLAMRLAFAEVAGVSLATGGAAYGFFVSGWLVDPIPTAEAAVAASAMGCAAAAGSSSAVDLIENSYTSIQSRLLPLIRHTSRIGDLLAIAGLGVLFCVFHVSGERSAWGISTLWPNWMLMTIFLGLGIGVLFAVFLSSDADENSRFLTLVGIIVFAAGAAFFLEISAVTVNLMLGVAVVNSQDGPAVKSTLNSSLKPVTLVLMIVAGAMWAPVDLRAAVVAAVGYILVRGASKALALFLATMGQPVRRDLFRGLMAQGDVAIAIAVSFRLVYDGPAADLAYSSIIISVMVHELVAPRLLKGLLIEAGELDDAAWSGA